MSKNEEFVDFVARDGVTIYAGSGVTGNPPGSVVRLPKSHADAFAHLRERPAAAAAKPAAQTPADLKAVKPA